MVYRPDGIQLRGSYQEKAARTEIWGGPLKDDTIRQLSTTNWQVKGKDGGVS
jgi:hypothetical protein